MREQIVKSVNRLLGRAVGGKITSLTNLYPWQRNDASDWNAKLEREAPNPQDPRLAALQGRYRKFDPRVITPAVWDEQILSKDDICGFRGNTQYVWQRADMNLNEIAFALSYYSLKAGEAADLLQTLEEDGAFGALTLKVDNRLISRDLLDSVGEIDFLRRHVQLGERRLSILDIGAGYGRLAHRISEAMGSTTDVFATDAFAGSTFLSEYYLAFRQTGASVLALDEVEAALASKKIDIATNIHSFSECRVDAITWWVELLAKSDVKYLMVVPNGSGEAGQRCLTNEGENMISIFKSYGYTLKTQEPRHADPFIQRFGVDPCTFFIFART